MAKSDQSTASGGTVASGGVSNDGSVVADPPVADTARGAVPAGDAVAPWLVHVNELWQAIEAIKKSVEASLGSPEHGPLIARVATLERAITAPKTRHPMGL